MNSIHVFNRIIISSFQHSNFCLLLAIWTKLLAQTPHFGTQLTNQGNGPLLPCKIEGAPSTMTLTTTLRLFIIVKVDSVTKLVIHNNDSEMLKLSSSTRSSIIRIDKLYEGRADD
jgi:hypothetical protein